MSSVKRRPLLDRTPFKTAFALDEHYDIPAVAAGHVKGCHFFIKFAAA
jgi:hypothetical protein